MKHYQHSLMKQYSIKRNGTLPATINATAIRMANDINGNPRHKVQIWLVGKDDKMGTVWSPTIKGYRRSKDDTYVLKCSYDLEQELNAFMKHFEECIND